jgi:hypothetical protein
MKHKYYRNGIIALMGLAVINVAAAADYSGMSTEEMVQMRSQVRDMSSEDRNSFRNEMRSRVQSMSPEERASFQQTNRQNAGMGSGQGQGSGGGYGSGYGSRQGGGNR